MTTEKYEIFRQMFPVVVGSLTGVTFGTMLGWPSVVYPLLTDRDNSPILITWDQSSLTAGFLMEGNIIGTAFSHIKIFGSRVGVLISCGCQVAGWIVMYYSQSIWWFIVARGLVGIGNGFSSGQLRMYISETCKPSVQRILMQYMPLAINIGVVFIFSVGAFTTFRSLSIVCFFLPTIALFLFAAVPKKDYSPIEEDSIATITNPVTAKQSSEETKSGAGSNPEQLGFLAGLKNHEIRRCLFLSWFLIFVAQYTGGSANVVYSQIVHMAALNPYPRVSSIVYSVVFLLSNFFALKYTNKFPRRPVVIGSCIICSLLLCCVCFYFYFMVDLLEVSLHFVWSPLILLSTYNFFHTTGINIIPILLIADIYPKNAKVIGSKFYLIYFSISAVFSTKIFQVLFTKCGMHMSYVFLSAVAFMAAIIIACFVKEPSGKKFKPKLPNIIDKLEKEKNINQNNCDNVADSGKYTPTYQCYYNDVDLRDEIIPSVSYCSNCRNIGQNCRVTIHHLV